MLKRTMLKRKMLLLPAILVAQLTFGQSIGGPQIATPMAPNFDGLKQALGLGDAQVQQLQQIQKDRAAANQTFFRQMTDKQKQLNELLTAGTDAFAIGQLQLDIEKLRKQVTANSSTRDQALAILDGNQKAKLAILENALQLQRAVGEAIGLGLLSQPQVQPMPMPMPMANKVMPR